LNLEYFPAQITQGTGRNEPENAVEMIQHNLVKSQLRSLGYKIVAFETGYRWTEWRDADYFFQHSKYSSETGTIDPFESILVNTTAVRFFADVAASVNRAAGRQILPDFDAGPYQAHVQRQLYLLEELEDIPSIPGPKFVFVHGLITHSPLVFNPNGEISKTPCEYTQELRTKEERDCLKRNYTSAVMFTNTRMLRIIKTILEKSSIPPVIILQGDHGVQHISAYQILNAYYLPEKARQHLYPTITPINSFRLLLSDVFGANYPLLPDVSYLKRNYMDIVPEESAACKAP
jgi:hypothetical protein